jgi:exopolysaccharide/PEP-CTERM locus tyrosine autokinase
MGKIADALERHKKEKTTKVEFLHETKPVKPMQTVNDEQEIALAKEVCTLHDCNPKLVVLSKPDSADAENFKLLRGQILFTRDRKRPRTIMVTSTFPGEGKTFVAANLAATLALSIDEHVLLIDCDLRRPRQHEMFGFSGSYGLHEYLVGDRKMKDLIVRSQIEKLSILPAGKTPRNPTELLSSAAMRSFLEKLRDRYQDRFIVMDSAPSHITAEAKVLAEYVDGIVLVVMAQKSPRKEIQRAIDNLGREKILGIVFNGYSHARRSYHKYYEKYYRGE